MPAMLQRPFESHSADQNKCNRASVRNPGKFGTAAAEYPSYSGRSQPGRCLCLPRISLLTTASAWRQQLQDVFKSPPLMSCWGRPSASRNSHNRAAAEKQAPGLPPSLHLCCGGNNALRFRRNQLVSTSLSFSATDPCPSHAAARAGSHPVMEWT